METFTKKRNILEKALSLSFTDLSLCKCLACSAWVPCLVLLSLKSPSVMEVSSITSKGKTPWMSLTAHHYSWWLYYPDFSPFFPAGRRISGYPSVLIVPNISCLDGDEKSVWWGLSQVLEVTDELWSNQNYISHTVHHAQAAQLGLLGWHWTNHFHPSALDFSCGVWE